MTVTFRHPPPVDPTWFGKLVRVDFNGKRLIGASFRGVPFFVDESTRSGGRRTVVHEFPLRDEPFVEDLGRRARKFPITGYVIGDDYLAQRDALLTALEDTEGSGALVHPYHGQRRAICDTVTVRESKGAGGIAEFSIEFIETPAQAATPVVVDDAASKVSASADAAEDATDTQLATDYDATGLPTFALQSAETAVTSFAASVASRLAPAVADVQELAALNGALNVLATQATAIARSPASLITQARTAFGNLLTTAKNAPDAMYNALVAAYSDALGTPVIGTTTTSTRAAANQTAITAALRRMLACEAARLAPTIPFASIEDATAARDQVAALLDEQAQTAGDDAYPALVDLRAQVLRAVPGASVFARVVTVTRRTAIPSLVLACQLYGSVDQEPDILARNKVKHPGFLVGDLKVLSNAG